MPDRPYNPLDRANLARSVETTLFQQHCQRLPLLESFSGAGLYALYYSGNFPAYQPISSLECKVPIYVGKADPAGARKGLISPSATAGPVLYKRIADHSKSISLVDNLEINDFRVRYLVVEDIFIGMGEQLLIQQFQPLWNAHLPGFGLHTPGKNRFGGERSEWDELHPGRPWYALMVPVTTPETLEAKIHAAFASGQAATLDILPTSSPPVELAQEPIPRAPETTQSSDFPASQIRSVRGKV